MARTSGERSLVPGHATILLPSREHGPVKLPAPPGGATTAADALDALVVRFEANVDGMSSERLSISATSRDEEIRDAVTEWVAEHVPQAWRDAAPRGRRAIREVRPRADYVAWYPVFAASGLAVATWPVEYCGLDLPLAKARVAESVLAPLNLGTAESLLGCTTQPRRCLPTAPRSSVCAFLPPMVANQERWCQMFSEPGAGSDLASLAMRAEAEWRRVDSHRPEGVEHVGPSTPSSPSALPAPIPPSPSAGASPTSWSTCRCTGG